MKCPRCQQDNPSHAKFCLGCGAPLGVEALGGSYSDLQAEIEKLRRSLGEAAEQQRATAEILRAISASSTGLQGVLDTVAARASSLCGAANVSLYQVEGDVMRKVAERGPQLTALPVGGTRPITRGSVSGRAILDRSTIHLRDQQAPEVSLEFPDGARQDTGIRTTVGIPLLREGLAIGAFTVYRTEYRPFSDGEIALLRTFADQAVIAIENVRLFTDLQEKNGALTEALDQQTATSEILRVIASSPTDVQPVFDTILASATMLLDGFVSSLTRRVGEDVHMAAFTSMDESLDATVRQSYPVSIDSPNPHSVAIRRCEPHIIADADTQPNIPEPIRRMARARGWRSNLVVPLRRGGMAIGALGVSRRDARGFTPDEIALLQTFADQAVIAIENVRLFNELKEKNHALTEALEQQTATAEILRTISSSPTDLQPVFDTIVRSAARVCGAFDSVLVLRDGDDFVERAHDGPITSFGGRQPLAGTVAGRAILEARVIHVPDLLHASDYPVGRTLAQQIGYRTTLIAPLLRGGIAIGAIGIRRTEVLPFSDKQIVLLRTFADQAVIAIENVRLFKELQARNVDLTDALDRQTATAEILRVISQSQTEVRPVFDAIVDNAIRLFQAWAVAVFRLDGTLLHLIAARGGMAGTEEDLRRLSPWPIQGPLPAARCVVQRALIHIPDVDLDPTVDEGTRVVARTRGWRSLLAAPMLRDGHPIGAITVTRAEAGVFSSAEVELLETFADQAVIAVENARLLGELRARTADLTRSVEQLTALGEVGRAVSSTLDLETVLTTIVSRAVELSGLDGGVVFEYDDGTEEFIHRVATETGGALAEARRTTRIRKGEGVLGRTAITLEPVQVPDITVPGAYDSRLRQNLLESGIRAILAVPMLREGRLIGCLAVTRNRSGEFPPETIDLLRTFATQSALAIQNARLFREIEQKSRELEAASRHKSDFLANMSHELRTPLNAIIGFSEVLSERMFGELNDKQDEYLKDIHASGQHLLSLINDILDLSKIEAGKMELEVSDFDLPTAIDNALMLVRERATRRGIELHRSIDEGLGQIQADERKIRQVLLNLLSNAIKFTPEGGRMEVWAKPVNGFIEVSVADTGVGIAPEDQEAVFEEFRQVGTAEKKVEGTGLGLALSRKFIELHGGKIWVKSQVGAGSTFTFTVPVRRGK
jgi:signal transduction histidine kinase